MPKYDATHINAAPLPKSENNDESSKQYLVGAGPGANGYGLVFFQPEKAKQSDTKPKCCAPLCR